MFSKDVFGPSEICYAPPSGRVSKRKGTEMTKRDKAWAEFDKARDAAWAEYEKARKAAWAEYDKVRAAAYAEYEKVRDAA